MLILIRRRLAESYRHHSHRRKWKAVKLMALFDPLVTGEIRSCDH